VADEVCPAKFWQIHWQIRPNFAVLVRVLWSSVTMMPLRFRPGRCISERACGPLQSITTWIDVDCIASAHRKHAVHA